MTQKRKATAMMPADLHPLTKDLVFSFALALAEKLHAAEQKYGYSDGWRESDWMDECRAKLLEHIAKGDPRDVANYCAFLWYHGERTARPSQPSAEQVAAPQDETAWVIERNTDEQLEYLSFEGSGIEHEAACAGVFHWFPANQDAIRFARRVDAVRALAGLKNVMGKLAYGVTIRGLRPDDTATRVAEHIWVNI